MLESTASGSARFADVAQRALAAVFAWRWLLLADLFLISPVLLYNLELRSGGRVDSMGLWNLATSVLVLGGLQLLARRQARLLVVLLPFALVVAADLFVIFEFDSRLNSAYLAVIAHSFADAGEFVDTFSRRLVPAVVAFATFYGLCVWKLRGKVLRLRPAWGIAALGLAAILHAAALRDMARAYEADESLRHVMLRDTSSPFGIVPQALIAYRTYQETIEGSPEAEAFRFEADRARTVAAPEVYVMVVGETSRPHNWALNGYARDTSPRLARLPELVSFTDLVTQSPLSRESVPFMLTRGSAADPGRAKRERSVVSAFAEAGFRTAWLSSQEVGEFTGRIHHIAAEAEVCRFFERRHDEALIAPFDELLAQVRAPTDKLFVVVHVMGSHFAYENRVPEPFLHFSRLPARSRREWLVNKYDDTIRYTDHVLGELIARLQARPEVVSALLFVSDHGENLMDDERRFISHGQGTRHDLASAAFFWPSDAYARLRPEAVALARARARAPLSTDVVLDSLADLGGLVGPRFDRSRSLFSPMFVPRPRLFVVDGRVREFDALRR